VDYIGQAIGSIFSIFLVHKLGIVKAMSYAALLSVPFIISLIFPTLSREHPDSTSFIYQPLFIWLVNISTNLVSGFGQGVAQPASGTFISDCATENTKGIFFAFSWACYMGSQVIGSLISGAIFSNIPFYWYSIIMAIILIIATIFLFFLKLPHIAETNFLRERTDSV
jgi:hypothetical protein